MNAVLGFEFSLPSPDEQRWIVGILDKAFAAIATAKANAEKNLQNARALFESLLQSAFNQQDTKWANKKLREVCDDITVGHVGSMANKYKVEGIPFLRSQNILPFQVSLENVVYIDDVFNASLKKSQLFPGDLAIVRTGYPGTAAVIPKSLKSANCSDLVIIRPSKELNSHFLALFFNSSYGRSLVLGNLNGAAQKHFNISVAKEVVVPMPSIIEQRHLVAKIDIIREQTQRLESICQRKLAALDKLKKSLLHQAFSGELIFDEPKHSVPTTVPFPITISGISTTDLHAGILAMAYQLHENNGTAVAFTHIKAEKIAHMVEACVGINLDRKPIKDAAGPNDFQHLIKVESRAGKSSYFDFRKQNDGKYQFIKLRGFNAIIEKTARHWATVSVTSKDSCNGCYR